MRPLLFVCLKYLKNGNRFLFSRSNIFSLLGITIGVFAILVVSSFMNGLHHELLLQITDQKPDIVVQKVDGSKIVDAESLSIYLENKIPDILASTWVLEFDIILKNGENYIAATCYGIELSSFQRVGTYLSDFTNNQLESEQIILGKEAAFRLDVFENQSLTMVDPTNSVPTAFGLIPKMKSFKLSGSYFSTDTQLNSFSCFITHKQASDFTNSATGLHKLFIKTKDPENSYLVAKSLETLLGEDFLFRDWSVSEVNLFKSLQIEKIALNSVLFLIVLLAIFNMSSNFVKMVFEKQSEIGIMKAIGFSDGQIFTIFNMIGTTIGFLGALFGTLFSYVFIRLQQTYGLIPMPVKGLNFTRVPVELNPIEFYLIFALVLLVSYFSCLIPAGLTRRFDPIKTIRDN